MSGRLHTKGPLVVYCTLNPATALLETFFHYLSEAFSPLTGFLYGWTLFLVIQTGIIDAVAIGFARYLGVLVPGISENTYLIPPIRIVGTYAVSLSTAQLIAIIVIFALSAVNALGLRHGKFIQNIFTVSKLVALAGVILLGLTAGRSQTALHLNFSHPWATQGLALASSGLARGTRQPLLIAMCLAQVGSLFAADAWNNITFTAGKVVNPRRNLALSLTIGTLMVMVLYFLANLAYVFVLPLVEIARAPSDHVGGAMLDSIYLGYGVSPWRHPLSSREPARFRTGIIMKCVKVLPEDPKMTRRQCRPRTTSRPADLSA